MPGSTGILVGSARVAILPDMRGFLTTIQAEVKSALKSVDATVPVKFTVDPLSVAKAQAALGPLAGTRVPVKFDVDKPSLARAQTAARNAIGLLPGGKIPLSFDLNTSSLARAMAQFRTVTGMMPGGTLPLNVAFNPGSLTRAQAAFRTAMGMTPGQTLPLNVDLSQSSLIRSRAEVNAALGRPVSVPIVPSLSPAFLAAVAAAARVAGAAGGAGAGGAGGGGGGGLLAGLGAAFGGGAGGRTLGFGRLGIPAGILGGVAAWHVALDSVLEAMLAIGLATAAAATGVAAMAESARNIYTHLQAVQTVSSSLGQHIAPLTGAFDKIAIAMAPQTLEVYGAGLDLVGRNTAAVAQTARQVVTLFDDWAAKIDLWAKAQGGFGRLLHSGVGYLAQFGHILGTVGQALGNLLHKDPGVAHYLLDIVGATAKVFQLFTELPAPIVSTALALHGIYIWGRVLGGVLRTMGTGLARMATSLAGLAVNPLVWVGVAAAAVGYFTVQASRGTPAAQRFIAAINQRIDSEQASRAITDISDAIGQLNNRIRQTDTGSELRQMFVGGFGSQFTRFFTMGLPDYILGIGHAFAHLGDEVAHGGIGGALSGLGGLFKSVFTNAGAGAEAARIDVSKYNAEINHLLGSQRNLFHETGVLMQGTRTWTTTVGEGTGKVRMLGTTVSQTRRGALSYVQALRIMNLAGVRASDSFALMQQKVQNLIRGYANAGIQGGLLGNSVNAVTFASLQQQSKITQLTEAWTTFFTTITSGETAFTSFASDIRGNVPVRPVDNLNQAIKSVHGNFSLLTAKGLQARDEFISTAQAAQTEQNSLMTLSSAAGMGARGTHLLQQATKDMIVQMLPAARHSRALTTVLYALAQQGGYHGADAFKALTNWVGKPAHPMQQLDRITSILTVHAGNLAKDVKNLSIALGQTLTAAEKQAIFYADGGQRAFNNYAEALKHNGIQSDQARTTGLALAKTLISITGNTKDAHAEFDAMTIGMGKTKAQADRLWNSLVKTAKAEAGLHDKKITITEFGSGSFSISEGGHVVAHGVGRNIAPAGQAIHPGMAAGGFVAAGTTPTADDVLARVSKGELIVPAKMVSAGLVDHLRGMIPGFQAGGVAGADLPAMTRTFDQTMTNVMTKSMLTAMNSALQSAKRAAARAAAAAALPTGGGYNASYAAEYAYAKSLFPQYGWSLSQFPYLLALWNQESGWNPNARNPSSGAAGIPQDITGNFHGGYRGQIAWGENYIHGRYGSPAGAWAHEKAFNWYDAGGVLPPGLSLAANLTGSSEFVLRPDQLARIAANGERTVNYNISAPGASLSDVRAAIAAAEVRSATLARIGRRS